MSAVAADIAARFGTDLGALVGAPERVGIALSGGPDSLALLLLASAALPGRVAAATVDHGLRAESGREARDAAAVCARIGCPHAILTVRVPTGGEGLQGEARRARYEALRDWCEGQGLPVLLTAHHADDQAETILMRLRRGSGLAGLSGIRPVRQDGKVLIARPLLGWSKTELVQIVAASGLAPADDPSNRDARFDRVAMRRLLAEHPEFEAGRLARSAAALRAADDALDWTAERLMKDRCAASGKGWLLEVQGLPAELRRRLLLSLMGRISPDASPRGEEVQRLAAALERGEVATLAGVKCSGGPVWRFEPAPARRSGG